ncbi:MAG: 23S rRNA (uracil(1939)-C(5))-methyltransferase RlmD [Arenimonas sp.]|uniref:23S rRNA (uracil(1939)-C(5))-methyltransferase RlmD n=1 Tax=Arenimonas sp. TaxID=1872635 RepID=UPI0025B8E278|nr:23S rRNA (uracil(1939)-C(5))-methyltransferase RlmD [Arenimonas sp.]MBW8369203.1 23S rRNA (uracil(1939)-C(5))-methyltransferase RlmD [Arenimonas sp.]
MARSRSKIHQVFEIAIDDLGPDGRGVGLREGKTVLVAGALPGEAVRVQQTGRNRHYDEARTVEVIQPSPDRVAPRCPHFGTCAGCVLQHLEPARQIEAKQRVLFDHLRRDGQVSAERTLAPLVDAAWGYRRKGRFSVRWVEKKGRVLVGFRETDPRYVADLSVCHTVVPLVGQRIEEIAALVGSLDGKRTLPQIEFIAGDEAVALVFRHLEPLSADDLARLTDFAKSTGLAVFLQPGGLDTVHALWPAQVDLSFAIPGHDLSLAFRPLDFIQVNAALNGRMIDSALKLLDAGPEDRVLDLFCGLGNFTLPLARRAGQVVGVEGDAGLVARARENAARNGLANVQFHAADLAKDLSQEPWMAAGFDKLLLDPPRAGAAQVLAQLPLDGIRRIVYVSCHPGSLARDAGFLVRERGYTLKAAGAMDMFPQTAHVESIALFEK